MAAITAITDTVHFAQTDLVNWTLVADDTGLLIIDAGFPGHRDEVLDSVRAARVRRRRHPRLPAHPRARRPLRLGDLVRQNPWHAGLLPRRRGRPRPPRVPRAGVTRGPGHQVVAAPLPEVDRRDRPQGRDEPRRHPDRTRAHRRGRRGPAGHPDGDSHPRPHRRALLVPRRRRTGQRRCTGDGASRCRPAADRSCCPACSTTIRTAVCAAWRRSGCSTPRWCCPDTARYGGVRPRGRRAGRAMTSIPLAESVIRRKFRRP